MLWHQELLSKLLADLKSLGIKSFTRDLLESYRDQNPSCGINLNCYRDKNPSQPGLFQGKAVSPAHLQWLHPSHYSCKVIPAQPSVCQLKNQVKFMFTEMICLCGCQREDNLQNRRLLSDTHCITVLHRLFASNHHNNGISTSKGCG